MEIAQTSPLFLDHRRNRGVVSSHLRVRTAQQKLVQAQRYVAAIVAIWLVIQMFDVLFTINGSYELALTVCVVWIAVPLFFAAPQSFLQTTLSTLMAGKGRASVLLMIFVGVALASAAMSGNAAKSAGYLLATIVTLALEYELCTYLGSHFNLALRWYSVLGTLAYLPFYLRGAVEGANWGRLSISEGDHPNHFGLVCFSILGAAFAWRSWPIRLTISGAMIAMIMAAQSRSSLISGLVLIAVFTGLELKRKKAVLTAILLGGVTCIAIAVSLQPIIEAASSVLNLRDQYRGSSSGLSGRVDLWQAGVDIFLEHPLLGVGFRLQDEALPAIFQAAGAVHNGFLGTLVEVGLLGSIPLFWFIWIGMRKLWRDSKCNYPGSQLGLCFVIGYFTSALVEPRLLSLAHPASVIAWCFLIGSGIQMQSLAKAVPNSRRPFSIGLAGPMLTRPAPQINSRDWTMLLKVSREKVNETHYRPRAKVVSRGRMTFSKRPAGPTRLTLARNPKTRDWALVLKRNREKLDESYRRSQSSDSLQTSALYGT